LGGLYALERRGDEAPAHVEDALGVVARVVGRHRSRGRRRPLLAARRVGGIGLEDEARRAEGELVAAAEDLLALLDLLGPDPGAVLRLVLGDPAGPDELELGVDARHARVVGEALVRVVAAT